MREGQIINNHMSQKESWKKEFEKVMGCIPECANGLYEDVNCPAHGYYAIKAVKFFRGVLSQREKEIAEEVEKIRLGSLVAKS